METKVNVKTRIEVVANGSDIQIRHYLVDPEFLLDSWIIMNGDTFKLSGINMEINLNYENSSS